MLSVRKKILFAATTSRHIFESMLPFITMMDGMGYHVDILSDVDQTTPYLTGHPSVHGVYRLKMCSNPLNPKNIIACQKIKQHLKINHYAIIHTHTPIASMLLAIAGNQLKKTKVVCVAENIAPYPSMRFLDRYLHLMPTSIAAHRANALVTTNLQDFYFAKMKYKHKNVQYIPGLGLDLTKDMERPLDKHFRKVILCVHDFKKYKYHDIMLQALPLILNKIDDVEVWFVGQGETLDECIEESKEMSINRNIEWMGVRKDLEKLLYKSDMVVFTASTHHLSPIVIHAMACGKPVVAINHKRNQELVKNEQNGYLVPPHDANVLADACLKVLNHKSAIQMSDSSRFMSRKFDVEHIKNLIYSIYKNC